VPYNHSGIQLLVNSHKILTLSNNEPSIETQVSNVFVSSNYNNTNVPSIPQDHQYSNKTVDLSPFDDIGFCTSSTPPLYTAPSHIDSYHVDIYDFREFYSHCKFEKAKYFYEQNPIIIDAYSAALEDLDEIVHKIMQSRSLVPEAPFSNKELILDLSHLSDYAKSNFF
jgi:methionine synthase II (cobalamin-independent)